jgi:hypothetical protein
MKLTIRDGRKDRPIAADGKGGVLAEVEHQGFMDIGDKIRLPDGTDVLVIGVEETFGPKPAGTSQTVFVGSIPG